jgi:V8-like Glu-specific endopeptidase
MIGDSERACTATIVGKHHIITASHCAVWSNLKDDSAPDPMIFQPGYNLGPVYPDARVIYSYWLKKVTGDSWQQDNSGGDWLVGVLDRDMTHTNGLFGKLKYSSAWNGIYLWDIIGYPVDYSQYSEQQVTEGPMAVYKVFEVENGEIYYLQGVAESGDSGSPLYGMVNKLPVLIGVVSGAFDNQLTMIVHGGTPMLDLIAEAVANYP